MFNDLSGDEVDIILSEFRDSFNRMEQLFEKYGKEASFYGHVENQDIDCLKAIERNFTTKKFKKNC